MINDTKDTRILLGDDHSILREGVISLLNNEKDLLITGEAENGIELVDNYFKLKPDIVITDITMPKLNGAEAIMRIKAKDPGVKALFLSMHEGEDYVYYTYKAGGSGLVNKNIIKGELIYAIRRVLNGELYFGPDVDSIKLNKIIERYETNSSYFKYKYNCDITEREAEILKLIGDGHTSVDISERLGISKRTIDTHRTRLIQKLNLRNLPELVRFAVNFNRELRDRPI